MSLFTLTVQPQRCALRYRHGVLRDVLPAGRHRKVHRSGLVMVDLREQLLAIAPQEIPTAEAGVSVRVSAVVRWKVADPAGFVERALDPIATVYLATQVALRDALAGLTPDQVASRGASAMPTGPVTAAVGEIAQEVGIGVLEVIVKDVILPAELRSAALEVLAARQRGAAQLETARAETAALRSLANGAKLLDAHPALERLRLVQAAPYGSQLVLRLGLADREPQD